MKSLKQFIKWYCEQCAKTYALTPTGMIPNKVLR